VSGCLQSWSNTLCGQVDTCAPILAASSTCIGDRTDATSGRTRHAVMAARCGLAAAVLLTLSVGGIGCNTFTPPPDVPKGTGGATTNDRGTGGRETGTGTGGSTTGAGGARVTDGGGSNAKYWSGDLIAAPGDSGSAVLTCVADASGLKGIGAAGVLTHLGFEVGVNQHGFVLGTTIPRAIEMALEAGLSLAVVFP